MLSLAVGALQMMLDRGEQKDWFGSIEIWLECGLGIAAFWVFLVHVVTADHPFVNLALMKDRNFVAGLVLIFMVGIILYSTLALLPPLLQDLMNYPVMTTGEVQAPRGISTMIAMLVVGRLSGRVDMRLVILFGFVITALSLWQMTGYSLQMDMWPVITAGIVQGFGLGFLFVPLSTAAFATLVPQLRTEGAALFSLVRNMGGSLGISAAENILARSLQVNHASLAAHVTPFAASLRLSDIQRFWDIHSQAGLAALDAELNRQAAMIAYIDDFKLMMIITLAMAPLLLLLRGAEKGAAETGRAVALD